MANGFDSIIAQLEQRKEAIERALAAFRGIASNDAPAAPARKTSPEQTKLDRRSEGQRRRWAAKKAAASSASQPAQLPTRKRGVSEEGRKKLAEAMKRRWAAKRAAAKKSARKKSAKAKSA